MDDKGEWYDEDQGEWYYDQGEQIFTLLLSLVISNVLVQL